MELGAFSVSLSVKDIGMSFSWVSAVFWPQMTHYQKRGKSTPPAECAARWQKVPALMVKSRARELLDRFVVGVRAPAINIP